MFTKSSTPKPVVYRTKHLKRRTQGEGAEDDSKRKAQGYKPEAYTNARIDLVGAGGLGRQIGHALVRKGVGTLAIFGYDFVELSNLGRQFFYEAELYIPISHR